MQIQRKQIPRSRVDLSCLFWTIPLLSVGAVRSTPAYADAVILSFELAAASPSHAAVPRTPSSLKPQSSALTAPFVGASNSLVARAVGAAEGTRTPQGDRTWAYYGHVDPGNGAWNQGSFSYQHPARSPEDADAQQLQRLQTQAQQLHRQASNQGIQLSLRELLNGLDLANQSPEAALSADGYIDWLVKLQKRPWSATTAATLEATTILEARTWAYWSPQLQAWDAPGLGNRYDLIRADQDRRQAAIEAVLTAIQHESRISALGLQGGSE